MMRRTLWQRAVRYGGMAGLAAATAAGCHLLPVQRINPGLDPRGLGRHGARAAATPGRDVAMAASTPPPRPAGADAAGVPLPELPLQPITDQDALATVTAPTPLLDAALTRAQQLDQAALETPAASPGVVPASAEVVEPPGTAQAPSTPSPTTAPDLAGTSAGGEAPVPAEPPPTELALTPTPEPATAEPAPVAPAEAAPATEPTAVPAAEPIAADPEQAWNDGLESLRSLARARLASAPDAARPPWALRVGLLDWMTGQPAAAAPDVEHPLWPVVLSLLAEAGEEAPGTAAPADPDLHAVALAIESRLPFEIADLQLCRKVRSFGNFDPLEPAQASPAQTLTLYCEMEGLSFEPVAAGGFRSRLAATLEIRDAAGETPRWTLDLGAAEDLCRKRRRDFYVNYRVTLPGPETLPPGAYRLALVQRDELSGKTARREVPLTVVPARPE